LNRHRPPEGVPQNHQNSLKKAQHLLGTRYRLYVIGKTLKKLLSNLAHQLVSPY
jgi:hypothetical protein